MTVIITSSGGNGSVATSYSLFARASVEKFPGGPTKKTEKITLSSLFQRGGGGATEQKTEKQHY